MRRSYLVGLSFAAVFALLTLPQSVSAQKRGGLGCSINPRLALSTNYGLVNKVGDIMTYYDQASSTQLDSLYFKNRDDYSFKKSPVYMPRTGDAWSLGVECAYDAKTDIEIRFSRGTSQGSVEGIVEQGTPYTIRLMVPTWQSHLFPLRNTDGCYRDGARRADLYCVGDIPYWSRDRYSSNSVDLLARRVLVSRSGFVVRGVAGINYERQKYTFTTGMKQHAKYAIDGSFSVPGYLDLGAYHYRFENFVGLETVSASTANFFGPALGLNIGTSLGRLKFAAEVQRSWRREWGRDTVSFVDTDDITETLSEWNTREEIFRSETFYDGFVGFSDTRSGWSTRTRFDLSADLRVNTWIGVQGGFSFSHSTGYLTQQLTDPWGLGSNKAPRAMELERIPNRSGMPTGFSSRSWWVGAKVNVPKLKI